MSTNREAGIGVCGIVIGIILGAGAMLYTNDYTVKADISGSLLQQPIVAFRGMDIDFDRSLYNRRAVNERDSAVRQPAEVITEPKLPRYYPSKVQEQPVEEGCRERLRVVAQLREAVRRIIPVTSDYASLMQRISAVLDAEVLQCQSKGEVQRKQVQSTAVKAVKPKPRVSNNCGQYGKTTQRYTRCIVNERHGQRYEGRQMQQR